MKKMYSLIQKATEFKYRNDSECGKIFMFHKIVNSTPSNNMELNIEDFRTFVNDLLQISSIKSITEIDLNNKAYYLTFDDIYISAYENALNWLTTKSIPFAVFITLEYLDKPNYITTQQLLKLANNKYCTIGSHTISHPLMRNKSDEVITREIVRSRYELEKLIKKPVFYFAYPYGSKYACPNKVKKIAELAGYKFAFSTYSMGLSKKNIKKEPFFLPRVNVDKIYREERN